MAEQYAAFSNSRQSHGYRRSAFTRVNVRYTFAIYLSSAILTACSVQRYVETARGGLPVTQHEEDEVIWPTPTKQELNQLLAHNDLLGLAMNFYPVGGFDWGAWQEEAIRLVYDPDALAKADLVTIQKLLVLHWRKDRFCEGHWDMAHRCGHLAAVARRLAELAEEME